MKTEIKSCFVSFNATRIIREGFENDQTRYHFSLLTLYFADAIFPSGRGIVRNA